MSSEGGQRRKREVLQGKGEHAPLWTLRSGTPKRSTLSINVTVTNISQVIYVKAKGLLEPSTPPRASDLALPLLPCSPPAPIGSSRLFWLEHSCGRKRLQSAFPSFSLWEDSPHPQADLGLSGEGGSSARKHLCPEMMGRCSRPSLGSRRVLALPGPASAAPCLAWRYREAPAHPGLGVFQGKRPGPRALIPVCPCQAGTGHLINERSIFILRAQHPRPSTCQLPPSCPPGTEAV